MPLLKKSAVQAQVIVARYRESIQSFDRLPSSFQLTVYDKFDRRNANFLPNIPRYDPSLFRGVWHAKTPTGREAHTYIYHILKHYPDFPKHLIFLQAGLEDHGAGILMRLLELAKGGFAKCNYLPLGWPIKCERNDGYPSHIGLPTKGIFERLFQKPAPLYFLYNAAALFIVSKERILMRPKSFYEEIMQIIYDEPLAGYVLERLWGVIFGVDQKLHRPSFSPKEIDKWSLPGLCNDRKELL